MSSQVEALLRPGVVQPASLLGRRQLVGPVEALEHQMAPLPQIRTQRSGTLIDARSHPGPFPDEARATTALGAVLARPIAQPAVTRYAHYVQARCPRWGRRR